MTKKTFEQGIRSSTQGKHTLDSFKNYFVFFNGKRTLDSFFLRAFCQNNKTNQEVLVCETSSCSTEGNEQLLK